MTRICKLFGKHIDIDKVVAVSELDLGPGPHEAVIIDVQLRDEPLRLWPHQLNFQEGWEDEARKEYDNFMAAWRAR